MEQSSRSFLIKKVDLTCKNKECTNITPHKDRAKYTGPKPVPQANRHVNQPRTNYQRDRTIEPVHLAPKKNSAYEELLRRAKLRKFESRDRRLQEFQYKKKLQQERKKFENECKRQQFMLNRERMKREQAERLLDMEKKRHEHRNRSFAKSNRMNTDRSHYNDYEESSDGVQCVGYTGRATKRPLMFSESTMSLYGIERNNLGKLCAGNTDDLESRKFRIYLPSKKSAKPKGLVPKTQPYTGPKCHEEMLVPADKKTKLDGYLKRPNAGITSYPSEDLVKPSYNGPTAMSMLNDAEDKTTHRHPKKCTSYKLSKSNLYAPSKLPIKRKKSKMITAKKIVAVCDCGRNITESEAQLLNEGSTESISSTREVHCFQIHPQVQQIPQSADKKHRDSKIPIRTSRYTEKNEKRHCKSNQMEEEGTCCSLSTVSSTVAANQSKISIKTVPSSRRTAIETVQSDETTEDGIDTNTISLTTKTLQSNPIDRTSTSVQCENSRWSQEDGSGEEEYSETFLCEETSLNGLMNTASELPEVEIKIADEVVLGGKPKPNKENVQIDDGPNKECKATKRKEERERKIESTKANCTNNSYSCNYTTARPTCNTGFPTRRQSYLKENKIAYPDQHNMNPNIIFRATTEAYPTPIAVTGDETQYIFLPTTGQESVYFAPYHQTSLYSDYQPWSFDESGAAAAQDEAALRVQPEIILAPCYDGYQEIIVLRDPLDSCADEAPIVLLDIDENYADKMTSFRYDRLNAYEDSEPRIVEINDDNDIVKESNHVKWKPSKDLVSVENKSQSTVDEFNTSKVCLHIRQIETALKDKEDQMKLKSIRPKESRPTENGTNNSPLENDQKKQIGNTPKKKKCCKSNKCQCGKRKRLSDSVENDPTSEFSSITDPCQSMNIVIDTFLVGKNNRKSYQKRVKHHQEKLACNAQAANIEVIHDSFQKPLENIIETSDETVRLQENQKQKSKPPSQSYDRSENLGLKSGKQRRSALNRSDPKPDSLIDPKRNSVEALSGRTECYNFCMPLGKSESKRLEARILCTCCSCIQQNSPKRMDDRGMPEIPRENTNFDTLSRNNKVHFDLVSIYETKSGRLEQPIKTKKRPVFVKCEGNDNSFHLRRDRQRAFRRCYRSELRTISNRDIDRNIQPTKPTQPTDTKYSKNACKCSKHVYPKDYSPGRKENQPPVIHGCKCRNHTPPKSHHSKRQNNGRYHASPRGSTIYLGKTNERHSESTSRSTRQAVQRKISTIQKRNHDRTPHRRGDLKKPKSKNVKNVVKKKATHKEKHPTKNESSTVFGLYEPTEYSVISLYRKFSDRENIFRANLFEIKRRYSHIITSSSSCLKRRSFNAFSPDSTSIHGLGVLQEHNGLKTFSTDCTSIHGFGILQEQNDNGKRQRSLSTITMYGSDEAVKFDDDQSSFSVEHLHSSSVFKDSISRKNGRGKVDYNSDPDLCQNRPRSLSKRNDRLYAGACCLIVPMSFSSLLQKIYSQTGSNLIQSTSSNRGTIKSSIPDYEEEPRLRAGGTYTPIFRNSQVQSLIRRIAVVNNFQEVVNSVSRQVWSEDENESPIKRYLTKNLIEKSTSILETAAIQLCNIMDELRTHRQGSVRLKSEEKFERDVRDCLYKLKAKILHRTPIYLPENLSEDLVSVLDEHIDRLQNVLVGKLEELCKDNSVSTSQFLYPTQTLSYSLQEIMNYLNSIDSETSARLCPLEILISSNSLAKYLLNQFLV